MPYDVTTFEWNGGWKQLPVIALDMEPGEPFLLIKHLSVRIVGGRCSMELEFGFEKELDRYSSLRNRADTFIRNLQKQMSYEGLCSTGWKFDMKFNLESGTPATELMMKKYLLLLHLCGIAISTRITPRIISETFMGDGHPPLSYGQYLMDKVLRGGLSALPVR